MVVLPMILDTHDFLLLNHAWIGVAIVTFLSLLISKIRAPYGRHANRNWGPLMANHWGWFWMELPALILVPALAVMGPRPKGRLSWMLVVVWVVHYVHRTLVFPFCLRTKGKLMPLTIVASAVFFNAVNGFFNGYWLGYLAPPDRPLDIFVIVGMTLFFTGMYVNMSTDHRLIALRQKQDGYHIPHGWLFEYVSCPNHLGEIMEWTGFAVAAASLPAGTFALWTMANLVPRALNHHAWYQETFKDYPRNRKAFVPGIW